MAQVNDGLQLTIAQRKLIAKSWHHSGGRKSNGGIGARILARIFEIEPELKRLFLLDQVAAGDYLFSTKFRQHSKALDTALDMAVHHVNDIGAIEAYIYDLGKRHVAFVEKGFKTAYWDVFAEAMVECAIDWEGGRG